jgi:hypothetical protein
VSRQIFQPLFPHWPQEEVPMPTTPEPVILSRPIIRL